MLAVSQLSDAALGEFLRKQGLHREQLEEWKRALEEVLVQPRRRGRASGVGGTAWSNQAHATGARLASFCLRR